MADRIIGWYIRSVQGLNGEVTALSVSYISSMLEGISGLFFSVASRGLSISYLVEFGRELSVSYLILAMMFVGVVRWCSQR